MRSYIRNSRKPLQALRLAVAAALLSGSAAHAAEPSSKFVLTAYTNDTAGRSLVSGQYDAAIDELQHPSSYSWHDAAMIANNKCVAYAMVGQFGTALAACSEAIASAHREIRALTSSEVWERARYGDYLAIAYANRAVVYWLSKDAVSAAKDLASAAQLDAKADFVVRNISALRSPHENAVAQLSEASVSPTPAQR